MERSAEINQFESLNGAARGADDEEERLSSSPLPSRLRIFCFPSIIASVTSPQTERNVFGTVAN